MIYRNIYNLNRIFRDRDLFWPIMTKYGSIYDHKRLIIAGKNDLLG